MRNRMMIFAAITGTLLLACENPFKNEISGNQRTLKGTVTIDGQEQPSGIFVYLEGLEIGVSTDDHGAFSLTMPKDISSSSGGMEGSYTLHFYLANYRVQTVPVIIRNDAFVLGEGRWNKDGSMRDRPYLVKKLDIHTELIAGYRGIPTTIVAKTILSAISDQVPVTLPNASQQFLGGIFFQNLQTGSIQKLLLPGGGTGQLYHTTIGAAGRTFVAIFDIKGLNLVPGQYRVIPHVLPNYDDLALRIAAVLGIQPAELKEDFFKFPIKFSGGMLQIKDENTVLPD